MRVAEAAECNAAELQKSHAEAPSSGTQESSTNYVKYHTKKHQQGLNRQKGKDPSTRGKRKHGIQDKPRPYIRSDSRDHKPPDCPYINSKCYQCDKVGHLASCSWTKADKPMKQFIKQVNMLEPDGKPHEYYLHSMQAKSTLKPIMVTFMVNGLPLEMEVDSRSPISLISEDTYHCHPSTLPWIHSSKRNIDSRCTPR